MLSPHEIDSASRGETFKRHIRAAAAMNGIYDDATLAMRVGAHRRTTAGWWSGARPSPDSLRQIADATGLSLDELNRFVYYDGPAPHLPTLADIEDMEAQDRAMSAERSHRARPTDGEPGVRPAPHGKGGSDD